MKIKLFSFFSGCGLLDLGMEEAGFDIAMVSEKYQPFLYAYKYSREKMQGHKLDAFVLGLSFIGWAILGTLTLGILYIWLFPYMQLTFTKFYLNILEEE